MDTNNTNGNSANTNADGANAGYTNTGYTNTDYTNAGYTNTGYTNADYAASGYTNAANTGYTNVSNTGYTGPNGGYTGYVSSPEVPVTHRVRGVVAALIGALLGGVAWTIIGCLGYISGYIAVLIFILASAGYAKFNGRLDTFGVIISLIFGLFTIIPATYCAFAFTLMRAMNDQISAIGGSFSYGEVLLDMPRYMDRYDLWGEFFGNLAMGYVFTIIVAVFFAIDAFAKRKKKK